MSPAVRVLILSFLFLTLSVAQSPNGTISGIVHDPFDHPIPDAEVLIVNDSTNIQYQTKTSDEGIYVVRDLPPGSYRIQITKRGFKTLIKPGLILNVQNALSVSITLPLGAVSEVVTVDAGAPLINTTDASVSTVVDRQFAENLPMNGRSFQSLIELTPGVVLTASSPTDGGQFSVDGQRAASNYWMVDGVGANVGISSNLIAGNGLGGSLGSFSAFGGTNSLVSVDAMQEFRVQTSGYAPEFGRTPGGQISIVTRSGTNQFHGTVFDYIRNDVFDANNWFNTSISPAILKPEERQNDFGGTFGGPIVKDHTFFFFSYEGLRLRLPQTALTNVPDERARESANELLQPYLNAFPLPNGPDDLATGTAQFNASYSNPASLDAYSLRVDHNLGDKLQLFGRYNYSPSEITLRGNGAALSTISPSRISMQTGTAGLTWAPFPSATSDLRFNYSQTASSSDFILDDFGGAAPLTSLPFPATYTRTNGQFSFGIISLGTNYRLSAGANARNTQRQVNIVENFSLSKSSHTLKFGADFRRLAPSYDPYQYFQEGAFLDVPSSENGNSYFTYVQSNRNANFLFKNLGLFAQDTWRVKPRLTVTYGIRWDVDFSPKSTSGPSFPAVTGFDLSNLSGLALSSAHIPPYKTTYNNFAPRVGAAYRISRKRNRQTVLRGGFGVFYDLATSETGNAIGASYPFGSFEYNFGGTFPLSPEAAVPPVITPGNLSSGALLAFDPRLELPYTLQWNVAIEQGLGGSQSVSISYIGATGRRLIQTADVLSPNANIAEAVLVTNAATSSYNAAQFKFERRLSKGLQVLSSYTFSHSIDDASAGSEYGNFANLLVPGLNTSANRGPSDFDIRHAFSAGLTYDIPVPRLKLMDRLFRGWSIQSFVFARSAPPVSLSDIAFFEFRGVSAQIRPDIVPGQPQYLNGPQYPGGVSFNPAAFTDPPVDPVTGSPTRQGNLGRNALRAFGATQWDFALHRDLHIRDRVTVQFRAEMFNLLNHPNFGPQFNQFGSSGFGISTQMLGASLNSGNLGGGAFSPLYQVGGPRSMQFALKLSF